MNNFISTVKNEKELLNKEFTLTQKKLYRTYSPYQILDKTFAIAQEKKEQNIKEQIIEDHDNEDNTIHFIEV